MSIVIKCEMCHNSYPLDPLQRPHERDVPDEWLTLVRGNPQTNAGFDFCSEQCLLQWMTGNIAQPQADKPECKTRRFVLYDNTTNERVDGVVWANGSVQLDGSSKHCGSPRFHCSGYFENGHIFDEHHFGFEITWIDQERKA